MKQELMAFLIVGVVAIVAVFAVASQPAASMHFIDSSNSQQELIECEDPRIEDGSLICRVDASKYGNIAGGATNACFSVCAQGGCFMICDGKSYSFGGDDINAFESGSEYGPSVSGPGYITLTFNI